MLNAGICIIQLQHKEFLRLTLILRLFFFCSFLNFADKLLLILEDATKRSFSFFALIGEERCDRTTKIEEP